MESLEHIASSYKACTQCKRLEIPFDDIRKTCERCRAKARKRSQAKKLASVVPLASMDLPSLSQPQPLPPQSSKRKAEETQNATSKAQKQIVPATSNKISFLQYQKASSLYDAIRIATSSSPRCNFAGCHSIVHCDSIDHVERAVMVTKDLRKIVKIPFKYNTPLKSSIRDTKVRIKYSCSCASSPPKTLTSTKSSNPQRGSDTVAVGVVCGGLIIVTVRNDDSHPLGIPGQQINVEIVH